MAGGGEPNNSAPDSWAHPHYFFLPLPHPLPSLPLPAAISVFVRGLEVRERFLQFGCVPVFFYGVAFGAVTRPHAQMRR